MLGGNHLVNLVVGIAVRRPHLHQALAGLADHAERLNVLVHAGLGAGKNRRRRLGRVLGQPVALGFLDGAGLATRTPRRAGAVVVVLMLGKVLARLADVLVVVVEAQEHVSGQAKVRQALGQRVGGGLLARVVVLHQVAVFRLVQDGGHAANWAVGVGKVIALGICLAVVPVDGHICHSQNVILCDTFDGVIDLVSPSLADRPKLLGHALDLPLRVDGGEAPADVHLLGVLRVRDGQVSPNLHVGRFGVCVSHTGAPSTISTVRPKPP